MTLCEFCHQADPHHPHEDCGDDGCHCDCRPWVTFSVRMPRSKVAQIRAGAQANYRSLSGQAAAILSESLNGSEPVREVQGISEPLREDLQSRTCAALELDLSPQGQDPVQDPTPPSTVVDIDDGFEGFWDAYPKRNGKRIGKAAARVAWRRLNAAERERAVVGARHLAESGQMPKDAERFLKPHHGAFVFDDWQEPAVASLNGARAGPFNDTHRRTDAEYHEGLTF